MTVFFRTFDEFKEKIISKTGANEKAIFPFLEQETFDKSPLLHFLKQNNCINLLSQLEAMEKDFFNENLKKRREKIKEIAEYLNECDRNKNQKEFEYFKSLICSFNQLVKKTTFDEKINSELSKAGIVINSSNSKNSFSKIKIEEQQENI